MVSMLRVWRLLTHRDFADMLAGGGLSKYMTSEDDEDDDADEQDLHDDPIWQLDLHVSHLSTSRRVSSKR